MKTINHFLSNFNEDLKNASRLADVLRSFADQYANVLAQGAQPIDLREKPNAQPSYALTDEAAARILATGERLPRRVSPKTFDEGDLRMSKIPCVPTAVDSTQIVEALRSILALKDQARVVDYMARKRDARAQDMAQTVLANLDRAVENMKSLDPSLTEYAIRHFPKAHIEDFDEAAKLDVTGTHHTKSDKGDCATIYKDDTRSIKSKNKGDHFHAGIIHSLDEDALLDDQED